MPVDPSTQATDAAPHMRRIAPRLLLILVMAWGPLPGGGCTTDDGARTEPREGAAEPERLAVPAIAVRHVDAPGFNIDELTLRLREAVDRASGAPCVDESAVRAELAACTEAPCADAIARQYREASIIVVGSVSRVGEALLATVRVQRGVDEVARATASSHDARLAVAQAGAAAGASLRALLVQEAPPAPPPTDEAAHSEGST